MVSKVLLVLLVAGAVTGSAVMYSQSSSTCPLTGACTSSCPVSEATCPVSAESEEPSCCASKSRAKAACCEGMDEALTSGGDAMAAVGGGIFLGR